MVNKVDLSQQEIILENFVELIKAPYGDFDKIGKLSRVLNNGEIIEKTIEFLSLTPSGKKALKDYPRLGKINLEELRQLPQHTLGYKYATHMINNELTPPPAKEIARDPMVFLGAHINETHDIWHVVTGCNTDKPGEVQLEAFYSAQFIPNPIFLALLAKNLIKTAMSDLELTEQMMDAIAKGWLMGKKAKSLFGIEWKKLWETPLHELQTSLNIDIDLSISSSLTGAKMGVEI